LSNFKTDISPWTNPKHWLQSNDNYINSVIERIADFSTGSFEIEQLNFARTMIYQHLIIYIFTHLMYCRADKRLLNDFKKTLQEWKAYNNIMVIEKHQLIRDYLIVLWEHGLQIQSHTLRAFSESCSLLMTLD